MYLLPCSWWGECTHGQGRLGEANALTALPFVGKMYPWAGRVVGCEYTFCPALGGENVPMDRAGWGMRIYLLPCPWWGECTHGQGVSRNANVLTALPFLSRMYPWAGRVGDENVLTALSLVGRMYPWAGRVGRCEYTYCPALGGQNVPKGGGGGDENVPTHPPDHLPQVSLCEMPPPLPLPYRPNRVGPLPRIPCSKIAEEESNVDVVIKYLNMRQL
jgi:hypothetical protein